MKQAARIVVALALVGCWNKSNDKHENGAGTNVAADDGKDEPKDPPPAPTVKAGGKGDCKTDYAPRPKRDPNPMCKIDGGTFTMGYDNEHVEVKLSPYYLDEFEVTVAQVAHYLKATRADDGCAPSNMQQSCFLVSNSSPIQKQPDGSYKISPGADRLPFDVASREGAMRYCEWAGKQLPTEAQWEFAARHDPKSGKDLVFPWGDEFDGRRARCDDDKCPGGASNTNPVDVGNYDGTNSLGDGRSPWGIYNMAGNAAELVSDCGAPYGACQGPCVDPKRTTPTRPERPCEVTVRGGASQGEQQLRTFNRATMSDGGFRCARAVR